MITRIQKWGNSLALRLPKPVAAALNLEVNSVVEIREEQGRLILIPLSSLRYSLDELLAEVRPENLHGEVDTGGPVGKEVW